MPWVRAKRFFRDVIRWSSEFTGAAWPRSVELTPSPKREAPEARHHLRWIAESLRELRSSVEVRERATDGSAASGDGRRDKKTEGTGGNRRRGWDSNPREPFDPTHFPGVPFQPLTHLSRDPRFLAVCGGTSNR